jgi:hypothetical protein
MLTQLQANGGFNPPKLVTSRFAAVKYMIVSSARTSVLGFLIKQLPQQLLFLHEAHAQHEKNASKSLKHHMQQFLPYLLENCNSTFGTVRLL